jgi:hypothetical protein
MDENEWLAIPGLVVNEVTSPGVKNPGGKNRRSNCVWDFSGFRSFECVPKPQNNGSEQARA